MTEHRKYDIILTLDEKSKKKILEMAASLGEKSVFYVDDKKYLAHVTVYSPEFPAHALPTIEKRVRQIAENTKKLKLEVKECSAGEGGVSLFFEHNDAITKLHKSVVAALNELREGRMQEKHAQQIKAGKYSEDQVAMINDFGYPYVLSLYRPHVTLGKLSLEGAEFAAKNMQITLHSAEAVKLAISEMGENGTCTRIIREFELG